MFCCGNGVRKVLQLGKKIGSYGGINSCIYLVVCKCKKKANIYRGDRVEENGVMFFSLVEIRKVVLITVFTGTVAWFMGYINEKNPMVQLFQVGLYIPFPIYFLEYVLHIQFYKINIWNL